MSDFLLLLLAATVPIAICFGIVYACKFYFRKIAAIASPDTVGGVAASCLFAMIWAVILFTKPGNDTFYGFLLWVTFIVIVGLLIDVSPNISFADILWCTSASALTLLLSIAAISVIFELREIEGHTLQMMLGAPIAVLKGMPLPKLKDSTPKDFAAITALTVSTAAFSVPGAAIGILARKQLIGYLNTKPNDISRVLQLFTRLVKLIAVLGSLLYAATGYGIFRWE